MSTENDALASSPSPAERHDYAVVAMGTNDWVGAEAYGHLERQAAERQAERVREGLEEILRPATVDMGTVDTDKADLAVLDLQLELLEAGHAKVKVDASGHVGLQVDTHLPPELHNRSVLVALNQRIARDGYAPRRRP